MNKLMQHEHYFISHQIRCYAKTNEERFKESF